MFFNLKAWIYSFFGLFVFTFIVQIFLSQYTHYTYKEKMQSSYQDTLKHMPKILEDLKVLKAAKIFGPFTFKNNSENLISKHVAWSETNSDAQAPSRVLFKRHPYHTKTDAEYLALVQDPEFAKIDVNWISELKKFDHLDLTTSPRVKPQLDRIAGLSSIERVGIHSTLPLLDFMDLINQATIFSIKKAQGSEKDKKEAVDTLHHVARLIISNSSLVAQMSAIVALRREVFIARKFKIDLEYALNDELIDRMKRLGFGWPSIIQLTEGDLLPDEIKEYLKPEFMVCGAAGEIPFPIMMGDFLESRWPFEPNFSKQLETSRSFFTDLAKTCHTESYLTYLKPIETRNFIFNWEIQNVPYARRIVSSIIMQIGVPNFLRQYDDLENARVPASPNPETEKKIKEFELLIKGDSDSSKN